MSAEASWYWTGLRTFPVLSLRCVLSASWCWIALFACCSVSCLRFVLLSYVSQWRLREQRSWSHSELGVADRSEGDIIKRSWCCSWLAWLRYLLRLSCCDHVLMLCLKHWTWCCEWFHAHVVWLSCHGMWWRPGKKLRRHLSLSSLRTSGKSDAMIGDILHFHATIWTWTRHITLSRSLGWIRRWKGDSDLCDDETVRAVLSECLSPLHHYLCRS